MRRAGIAVCRLSAIAAVMALALVTAVSAGATPTTLLQQAASALSHGHLVFVAGSTPGSSQQAEGSTEAPAGQPGEPIALVELPASALAETSGSGQQFANELDVLTGHRFIIGVAFVTGTWPNVTATYFTATTRIPRAQSDGQMNAAINVGQSPGDTLSQFAYYMSQWLQSNPGALRPLPAIHHPSTARQAVPIHHTGDVSSLLILVILLIVIGLCGVAFVLLRPRLKAGATSHETHTVPGMLQRLGDLAGQIENPGVSQTIREICQHTQRYLVRVKQNLSESGARDAERNTQGSLPRVIKVAEGYLDMTEHPDEWAGNTDIRKDATAHSLTKYNDDLLAAIQQANEGNAAVLEVNTSVLENTVF